MDVDLVHLEVFFSNYISEPISSTITEIEDDEDDESCFGAISYATQGKRSKKSTSAV